MAATVAKASIYEKLMLARIQFGETEKKKSGVNTYAEFTYYELNDIVPIATKILHDLNMCYYISFEDKDVIGTLYDCDTKESIALKVPFREISEPGKLRQHEITVTGSAITYYRRYCWALLLDLCDPDAFNASKPIEEKPADKPKETPKPPKTAEERKNITANLTDGNADEEVLATIQKLCKKVSKIDPQNTYVMEVAVATNKFKACDKAKADEIIEKLAKIIKESASK